MSSLKLRPLQPKDIPACARLAGEAFSSDRHTQLKAMSPTNPYDHVEGMLGGLRYWSSLPEGSVDMVVAEAEEEGGEGKGKGKGEGEILGWVVWGFRGFDDGDGDGKEDGEDEGKDGDGDGGSGDQGTTTDQDNSTRTRLEAHTDADMQTWMKRLMPPGSKCMYICTIVVHPAHQGRKVGSALLRRGTDRADAEGVYCWVHASEDGAGMFAKHGFKEVGRLEVDLDKWNLENVTPPEGEGAKWGTYTFMYMKREANAG